MPFLPLLFNNNFALRVLRKKIGVSKHIVVALVRYMHVHRGWRKILAEDVEFDSVKRNYL